MGFADSTIGRPPATSGYSTTFAAGAEVQPAKRDEDDPPSQLAEVLDRSLHYIFSQVTLGLSPMGLAEAYFDWLVHLGDARHPKNTRTPQCFREGIVGTSAQAQNAKEIDNQESHRVHEAHTPGARAGPRAS